MSLNDRLNSMMDAKEAPKQYTYFGEVAGLDAIDYCLMKGQPRRLWDSRSDPPETRRTELTIIIVQLEAGRFDIEARCLDNSAEWLKHTLPSLKKLSVHLGTLKGRYVQVKRVGTGRTYQNKNGETKEATALEFIEVYPDRATCEAAYHAWKAQFGEANATNGNGNGASAAPNTAGVQPEPLPAAPASVPQIPAAQAWSFIEMAWKANPDLAALRSFISSSPAIATHYPPDHPHLLKLTNEPPF